MQILVGQQFNQQLIEVMLIYITHIKPCNNCTQNIQQQIAAANNLGLTILYPEQGKTMVID
jgi:hypothetical protein